MSTVLAPPSLLQSSREALLGRDLVRLAVQSPWLGSLPRGDGSPAVLISGFGGGDGSLAPLRLLLRRLGHDARPAGLGRIGDDVQEQTTRVQELTARITAETGRAPALVGWSIGGVIAREVARESPATVRHVVTFGTPVHGGPSYTALAWRYGADELAAVRAAIAERERVPIEVPVTAIWSPNDGIVTPRACRGSGAEEVRVTSTHIGMGLDPDVWKVVARRLAA